MAKVPWQHQLPSILLLSFWEYNVFYSARNRKFRIVAVPTYCGYFQFYHAASKIIALLSEIDVFVMVPFLWYMQRQSSMWFSCLFIQNLTVTKVKTTHTNFCTLSAVHSEENLLLWKLNKCHHDNSFLNKFVMYIPMTSPHHMIQPSSLFGYTGLNSVLYKKEWE